MTDRFKDIKAVIADDHTLVLHGLETALKSMGIQILAAVSNGERALEMIRRYEPTLAILDIDMPVFTGLEVAYEVNKAGLSTQCIILTLHKEPEYVSYASSLNIAGYLLKEDTTLELANCLNKVLDGQVYMSPSFRVNATVKQTPLESLTKSERKILKFVASNLSSKETSDLLHISERTVEKHRSNIIEKLGLSKQANSLSRWAAEHRSLILNI